jgi:hypothetical protein
MKISELRNLIQDTINEELIKENNEERDFALHKRMKRDIGRAQNLIVHYIKNKDKNALIEAHKTLETVIQLLNR